MDYSPPPLFKQGASARAKVVIFSLIALSLLVADARLRSLGAIREALATALYPLQVVALLPRDAAFAVGDYFSTLSAVQRENQRLRQEQLLNAQTLQQIQQLSAENAQLRKLLDANERLPVKSVMSEILYDARDAFTRKIILDRGSREGVRPGQPVIDDLGVVGQVTRVYPFTAEVTLLTDKDQAVPVQIVRSGLRSIAYGLGNAGRLDLRFMPANADVQNGDIVVTSGLDGVYPPGLMVAKVAQVESKSSDAFARISLQPMAGIDRNRQLLILLNDESFPPRPQPGDAVSQTPAKPAPQNGKEGGQPSPAAQNSAAPGAAPQARAAAAAPAKPTNTPAPAAPKPAVPGTAKPATPAAPPVPPTQQKP